MLFRSDLGELANDELIELLGDDAPGTEEADRIIMAARAHWFDEAETAAESPDRETAADGDEARA